MKKTVIFLLSFALLFVLCACTSAPTEVTTAPTSPSVPVQTTQETLPPETTESEETAKESQYAVSSSICSMDYFSEDDVLIFQNKYPAIHLIADNDIAVQRITSHFSDFVNSSQIEEEIQEILSVANENYSPENFWVPYTVDVLLNAERLDHSVLSMFGSVSSYAGGPHPNHYLISANYRVDTGDVLALDDILLGQDALDALLDKVLTDFSNTDEDIYLFDDYINVVKEHFTPGSEKYGSWFLSENALCLYFSIYEISSYASGDFILEYPYSELNEILKEEYFLNSKAEGNGELTAALLDTADFSEKQMLGSLNITDDGPKIILSSNDTVYNVSLEQGYWNGDGSLFTVTGTLFKANYLDDGSYLKIQTMLPENHSSLRVRYDNTAGTQYRYLAADFSSETVILKENCK